MNTLSSDERTYTHAQVWRISWICYGLGLLSSAPIIWLVYDRMRCHLPPFLQDMCSP
jgi:hypothetical protein